MTSAYRSAPIEARFVCMVCRKPPLSVAAQRGDCLRCLCPMFPIMDEDVQAALRDRAARKKKAINGRRMWIVFGVSFALAFVFNIVLILRGVYGEDHSRTPYEGGAWFYAFLFLVPLFLASPIYLVGDFICARLHLLEPNATIDPANATTAELVKFL